MSVTAIIAFLIVFGLLVGFHEFGHFIVAKKSGVLVREFAIGMGPKILSWYKNQTAYTLRLLPVGGYVRMASEMEKDELEAGQRLRLTMDEAGFVTALDERVDQDGPGFLFQIDQADLVDALTLTGYRQDQADMVVLPVAVNAIRIGTDGITTRIAPKSTWVESAPVWKRLIINFAGPAMNFILAIVAAGILSFALPSVHFNEPVIGQVVKSEPAAQAGLRTNDRIEAVNGVKVATFTDFANEVTQHENQSLRVKISRDGQTLTKTVKPEKIKIDGQNQIRIGVGIKDYTDPISRIKFAAYNSKTWFTQVGQGIANLFQGGFSINKLGGPVMLAKTTAKASHQGWITVLALLGLLSVNLGLINLLPIPPLDGGKIFLDLIELIFRRPAPAWLETALTGVGTALLVVLMVLVTIKDLGQ
ncbi:RIP metalloprotease RseP [Fructobacillus ficulneus]|uniref:Zinc metalloprotease n=1 Tax=Fructobacillus ficulneus TaxID=157463 RepID=A0A0K8MK29_9LACO|nr:RIP metalloprotease RseP [Fructobacillus ficulneus]GAP00524.1 membrane-associated Zn-dependent protease [Fructobacillus ficulneus]